MNKLRLLRIAATAAALLLVIFGGIVVGFTIINSRDNNHISMDMPSSMATTAPTQTRESSAPPQTDPPVTAPPITEPPITEPPVTEPPEETQPPTTGPTEYPSNGDELIGNLYTRDQLAAIDGTRKGYGPGYSVNGSRPPDASKAQKAYGDQFNAYFIAPDNGKVYFTFCHGYERDNLTATVLDVLKEKNVKCVFFINRDYARLAPDMVWRMINEGHIVANHATKHPDMGKLTVDRMVEEIMVMHNYMVENFDYEMTLFRPPSGYYSPRLLAVAQSLGYTTVQWSYAYRDWDESAPPDSAVALADVVNSVHSGAIYQFHTVTASGVSFIEDAIDAIREKGYEFDLFTGDFE